MKRVDYVWNGEQRAFLIENYGKLKYQDIADALGKPYLSVLHQAARLNLTKSSNLGRKYCAKLDFFEKPNVLNSYWAGFIAADGCIHGNKLSIGLAVKDSFHLEQFRNDIGYSGPLHYYKDRTSIEISNKKITDDLQSVFSITERKSLNLEAPTLINETHVKAFICGLIDGDGSIYNDGYLKISMVGTNAVLTWMAKWFDQWVGLSPSKYNHKEVSKPYKNPRDNVYGYRISGYRALEIGKLLMVPDVPRLKRKWEVLIQSV